MEQFPLVTVYITTKDRVGLLQRAVNSVLNQSYENIQLIVVDDGSTDGTQEYLKKLQSERKITCILHQGSQGACVSRNEAIDLATGEFITGMDDDDWFTEDRVEKFVRFWFEKCEGEESSIAGLFSNSTEIYPSFELNKLRKERVGYKQLRLSNGVGNQVFAPKAHFIAINGFDPDMPAWQDWECWTRMSKHCGVFLNCNEFTYMQDASHDSERITAKRPELIRKAHSNFSEKLGDKTLKERLVLLKTLVDYRQVAPTFSETLQTLLVGDIRLFISCTKRLILGNRD